MAATGKQTLLCAGLIALMSLVGACAGLVAGVSRIFPNPGAGKEHTVAYPLPHHIAKYPGGTSLRFAMVHDVIHERFARHGRAYYAQRNRRTQEALETQRKQLRPGECPPEKYLALLDDLGAGLELLGEPEEAIRVLRDKRAEQERHGLGGRLVYTTYANLGTFLIHAGFPQAQRGEEQGRERMKEGLTLLDASIKVNPQAHFGREVWQVVSGEFFLAVVNDPSLLLRFDMVGNRLDAEVDPGSRDCLLPGSENTMNIPPWGVYGMNRGAAAFLKHQDSREDPKNSMRGELRKQITLVGAEKGWASAVRTAHKEPVPFDEPTLGIIGMWRTGDGANPHFALALGEIMMRVGQRYIAWNAYERGVRLAGRFWPDAKIQQQFIAHCRRRQAVIEQQLPNNTRERLRPAFEEELTRGQGYQQAYQRYEAEQIAAGADVESPTFHDAFHAKHGPIASPVGPEDRYVVDRHVPIVSDISVHAIVLFAGLFAFVTAVVLRVRERFSQTHPQ
jgi:hypothetical protein